MTARERIGIICALFGMTEKELAHAMNVGASTITRWKSGRPEPKGLHAEVLRGLHSAAVELADDSDDPERVKRTGRIVALGIGSLLYSRLVRALPL